MAKHLDLEEQEQLDELKHFWRKHGDWISWALIIVFGSIAGWNALQYWRSNQAMQAAGLYDEVDRAARAADLVRLEQGFADMKSRYGESAYAQQTGLLVASALAEKGELEKAKSALGWVAEQAGDEGYRAVARLRLAGLLAEGKAYEEALKQLDAVTLKEFLALAADRRGDIYALSGNPAKARDEYQKAYAGLQDAGPYRRLVEVKLNALGAQPLAQDKPTTTEAKK